MSEKTEWEMTHLCKRNGEPDCEYFLQTGSDETVLNEKKLDKCCYYCTSENKVRKIGSGGSWTGLSPKFCTKRKGVSDEKAQNIAEPVITETIPERAKTIANPINADISVLDLTVRSYNALKRMEINTVAELETRTADVMKMLPKTYPRIFEAVEEYRGKPIDEKAADNTTKPADEKQEIIPVPAEETPAVFNYSELDSDTADKLRAVSEKVISIKARYILETAKQVKIAHDLLASHDKTKGLFGAWCASVGFSRDTGNNLVRVAEVFPELDVAENFGNISPSLLYAASKPSAPPELVEGVKNGDITTHKDFIKLKKELEEANKRAENAEICRNEIIETNRNLVETCDKHYKNVQKLEARVKELDGEKNDLLCEIKELENRPVEVQQPDDKTISAQAREMAQGLIQSAESAADKRIRDYKEKLDSRSKEFTKELENLRNENTRLKDGVLHMVIQLTLDEYGALIKLTQGNEALCSAIKHSHIFKS